MKDFTKRIDKKRVSTKIIRPEKKHLGKKCAQKLISCSKSIGKGLRYVFVYLPKQFGDWIQKKTIGLGLAIGFELDDFEDEIQQENDFLNQGNKEAPDWPDVVNILLSEIHIAQELYEKKEKNKGLKLTFNFPNFSALLGKVPKPPFD
jgi:hypothetical protein